MGEEWGEWEHHNISCWQWWTRRWHGNTANWGEREGGGRKGHKGAGSWHENDTETLDEALCWQADGSLHSDTKTISLKLFYATKLFLLHLLLLLLLFLVLLITRNSLNYCNNKHTQRAHVQIEKIPFVLIVSHFNEILICNFAFFIIWIWKLFRLWVPCLFFIRASLITPKWIIKTLMEFLIRYIFGFVSILSASFVWNGQQVEAWQVPQCLYILDQHEKLSWLDSVRVTSYISETVREYVWLLKVDKV